MASPLPLTRNAELLRDGFDRYMRCFTVVTRRAKRRFEARDWAGGRMDATERSLLYEQSLEETERQITGAHRGSEVLEQWPRIKDAFAVLVRERCDRAVAETYFNSVTRRLFHTRGLDREREFFSLDTQLLPDAFCSNLFHRWHGIRNAGALIRDILRRHAFRVPFTDIERDAALAADEINLFLWPLTRSTREFDAEILHQVFFRNKAAYIVGRLRTGEVIVPLVIPLYNSGDGIVVDAVLRTADDVNNVFGFAYSPFQVVAGAPNDLVRFLRSIMPGKPLSEIYNSIGFHRHGKTEFYRDLHHYIHLSNDQYVAAPGLEGAVMLVYTMPRYDYVFKVIKDRPCFLRSKQQTAKSLTSAQVRAKYRFVSGRDRVGRLVDTQEFENLRFRRRRYSQEILEEFRQAATRAISIEDEYVIIHHCYLQRRVVPLPLFLEQEQSPEHIRRVIIDFGYFIKDLAGTGLFPSDLFNKWNYGVTERSRVVLYDFDDIMPLEEMRFRVKPQPRDDSEEWLAEEDRIAAGEFDFFMDEIERWLGIPAPLRGIFDRVHADLYTQAYWDACRRRLLRGDVADIFPYSLARRFPHPETRFAAETSIT